MDASRLAVRRKAFTERSPILCLTDVFTPDVWIRRDIVCQQPDTLWRAKIDDLHSVFPQPAKATGEIDGLPHHDRPDTELPHQSTAIPAGCQCRDHDRIAVMALPSRLAKRIRFAVNRRVVLLHTPVVAAPEQVPLPVKQGR